MRFGLSESFAYVLECCQHTYLVVLRETSFPGIRWFGVGRNALNKSVVPNITRVAFVSYNQINTCPMTTVLPSTTGTQRKVFLSLKGQSWREGIKYTDAKQQQKAVEQKMSQGIIMMIINQKYHVVIQSAFSLMLNITSNRESKVF